MMQDAVWRGDVKNLAELMRQNPGFDVNKDLGSGETLLHHACSEDSSSAVIPLLLAHPDIDVHLKNRYGQTPFYLACANGRPSCVREMLKDSRVSPTIMRALHSGGLLVMATLTSSSGGLRQGGNWTSGKEISTGRMPLGRQRRKARQKL